ncbi:UNVERIFIED_CONTAM: hypothetical protein Slati_2472100 [Sesamum latifolium]|uniref:Reverse transcriptase Ty1/copia-type domain-containing protein n=1 Tax=Sesamum latifolium TaxID=2727402 RepID=A0AAW2WGY1_9LAMI
MSNIDSDKWLEAIKSEMDSMGSNQVWTLVDARKGVRPVSCKWVYKHKLGADGEMNVKMAFLNGFVEEEIYMDQPEGLTFVGEEQKGYHFIKNEHDPCVYKKISGSSVAYLVLYVDDILLIGNDVKMLGDIKAWLSTQLTMKDMGEASYILGIKIYRDRSRRMRYGIKLSKEQSPKIDEELKRMSDIPYASAMGSIQYVVQCTRPDVAYALSVTSIYQACAVGGALEQGQDHT